MMAFFLSISKECQKDIAVNPLKTRVLKRNLNWDLKKKEKLKKINKKKQINQKILQIIQSSPVFF